MLEMKYFVLKPRAKSKSDVFATASQKAMFAYAMEIQQTDAEFAQKLRAWAREEYALQTGLAINTVNARDDLLVELKKTVAILEIHLPPSNPKYDANYLNKAKALIAQCERKRNNVEHPEKP